MIVDSPLPSEYGFDTYGAFNCAGEQMPVHEDADNAIKFIEQCHTDNQPFFVNLWIHEPHTQFHTVPKYRWRFRELEERDNIYASVLSHADDRIGEVLDTLDRLKLSENTLVIFSSDNGPARTAKGAELKLMHDTATGAGYGIAASKGVTGGRKGYKASLMEGGIGVPFIARWPGKITAGAVDKTSIMSAVDLLPTFCEIAGAQLPAEYQPDGISQLATLRGNGQPTREKPLFWKAASTRAVSKNSPHHWVAYAVAHEQWKLAINKDNTHVELYDLITDPLETTDLSQSHPEVVTALSEKLEQWKSTLPSKPAGEVFSKERESLK